MEGEDRFSPHLREAIHGHDFDGRRIVETSKLILLVDYSNKEYDEELFATFNLIIDEQRDGLSYDEIERIYKHSFVESVTEFRRLFSI